MVEQRNLARTGRAALAVAVAALAAGVAAPARAGELFITHPATGIATDVNQIFNLIFWICTGIFLVVWGSLAWGMYRYRFQANRQSQNLHGNTTLEIIWTVIPALILLIISVPTYRTMIKTEVMPAKPDLTVEVVGHQFYWEYRYPDQHFSVNNELTVPAGKNVELLITSADVIHDWGVHDFGFKRSGIPGRINEAWFNAQPGDYAGQCYELCGAEHAKMLTKVHVVAPAAFQQWLSTKGAGGAPATTAAAGGAAAAAAPMSHADLMKHGSDVFGANCASCHQLTGQGVPGTFPPLAGGEVPNGPAAAHIKTVLNGLTGAVTVKGQTFNGVMPPWKQLSDEDIAAVITYERNSWGNHGGDVTPAQVKAAR